MGAKEVPELLVSRVWDVFVAVGGGAEGEEAAVGEALRAVFDADVSAPFEVIDGVDLCGQSGEGAFNAGDSFGGCAGFETEEDDVAEELCRGFAQGAGVSGSTEGAAACGGQDKKREGKNMAFHYEHLNKITIFDSETDGDFTIRTFGGQAVCEDYCFLRVVLYK